MTTEQLSFEGVVVEEYLRRFRPDDIVGFGNSGHDWHLTAPRPDRPRQWGWWRLDPDQREQLRPGKGVTPPVVEFARYLARIKRRPPEVTVVDGAMYLFALGQGAARDGVLHPVNDIPTDPIAYALEKVGCGAPSAHRFLPLGQAMTFREGIGIGRRLFAVSGEGYQLAPSTSGLRRVSKVTGRYVISLREDMRPNSRRRRITVAHDGTAPPEVLAKAIIDLVEQHPLIKRLY